MVWTFRFVSAIALLVDTTILVYAGESTADVPRWLFAPIIAGAVASLGGMVATLVWRAFKREGPSMLAYGGPGSEGPHLIWKGVPVPARFIAPVGIGVLLVVASRMDL